MPQHFNPEAVPIPYTLRSSQVELLLEGLGKLPYEKVQALYNAIHNARLLAILKARLEREGNAQYWASKEAKDRLEGAE